MKTFAAIVCAVLLTATAAQAADGTCKPVPVPEIDKIWKDFVSASAQFTKGASGNGYQCLNSPTILACRIMTGNDPIVIISFLTRDRSGAIVRGQDGAFAHTDGATAGDC